MDKVTGEWGRLRNEQIYALYSSTHIIRIIKSRKIRWDDHLARMWGQKLDIQGFGGDA